MNKFRLLATLLFLAGMIFMSCNRNSASLPYWLEGQWATGDTLGLSAESWEVIDNGFMEGEGLFIVKDGRSIIEVLSIFIQDGKLFYAAMVPNQNNGEEIIFVDTQLNPDSLVFENPLHDYPQKIIYHHKSADLLHVYVLGNKEDDPKRIILNKVKE